jgi:hypothetical protein
MNYKREKYLWETKMTPKFERANKDFSEGTKMALFSIPIVIVLTLLFLIVK